jgi:branched-chain amino acid transport system permease protein
VNRSRRQSYQQIARFVIILAILLFLVIYLGSRRNFGLQQYVQLSLDGLRGGAVYALVAMGFVTVFNVTGIINFAQGAFVMLGAMFAVTFSEISLPIPAGAHLLLSVILAILVTTLIGLLVERLSIHLARSAASLTLIIITVGMYITLQGLALLAWGPDAHILPSFTTLEITDHTIRWAGLVIKAQTLWIWGVTAVVLIVLFYFFERTLLGKAMRACAVNRRGAHLVGISPGWMSLIAFGLAAALGAIGGVVIAPIVRPTYDMGLSLGLKGFVAAILGGLVSAPGAVFGGLLLGFLENLTAGVTKAGLKDIFAFVLLILTLLFRPQGLLGTKKTAVEASGEEH